MLTPRQPHHYLVAIFECQHRHRHHSQAECALPVEQLTRRRPQVALERPALSLFEWFLYLLALQVLPSSATRAAGYCLNAHHHQLLLLLPPLRRPSLVPLPRGGAR